MRAGIHVCTHVCIDVPRRLKILHVTLYGIYAYIVDDHPSTHIYTHVYTHVYTQVYTLAYTHVYAHVYRFSDV